MQSQPGQPNLDDLLTIVLTIKDRHPFTKRWLAWADHVKCPYRILIADGSEDDEINRYLKSNTFEVLRIRYTRYEPDAHLRLYFKKLAAILSEVETEFTLQADDDDFILFNNLADAVRTADTSGSDTVCVARSHFRLKVQTKSDLAADLLMPQGNRTILRKLPFRTVFKDLKNQDALTRLTCVLKTYEAAWFWYAIHRTSNLKRIHEAVVNLDFSLAMFQEWYLVYSTCIAGKCLFSRDEPFLVRQEDTSMGASTLYDSERLDRIFLQPSWSKDLSELMPQLQAELKKCDEPVISEDFNSFFVEAFSDYLSKFNEFSATRERCRGSKWFPVLRYLVSIYRSLRGNYSDIRKVSKGSPEVDSLRRFLLSYGLD